MQQTTVVRLALAALLTMAIAVSLPGGRVLAAADDEQPADVDREAYYTRDVSEGLPPALTDEFPHAVVCFLVPELCGEQAQPLNQAVHGVIVRGADAVDQVPQPVQPVVPGTLPVGMLGGQERYASALRFELPRVPEGQMIGKLELVLHPSGFSFATESPAFRRLVRAFVAQATASRGPGPFAEAVQRILTQEDPLVAPEISGVEACPLTEPWEEGESQPGDEVPERDCILGTTGQAAEDGTWVFDLTFAAEAWRQGDAANEGILLAPLGAENLEYGDPDYSTNFVVAFAGAEADEEERPRLRVELEEDFADEFVIDGTLAFDDAPAPPAPRSGFTADSGAGFAPESPVTAEQPSGPGLAAAEPDVADEALAADELPAFPAPAEAWLLLPLALAGGWWFARVVDYQPAAAVSRSGALTRITDARARRP